MLGCHLSIAGGLHNALIEARALLADCLQLFTQNQRQWRHRQLTEQDIRLWRLHRSTGEPIEVVSHGGYLLNLASTDEALGRKSLDALRTELLRCEALGICLLVIHPGCHMGAGPAAGLRMVGKSLDSLHRDLGGLRTVICLETTAGQGSSLGWRLKQIRQILDSAAQPERLAVCLDTAHLLAAGYDLTSAAGARALLDEADAVLGLARIRAVHVNDSKTPRGSRVDRHEHIGHGQIALAAFREIINHPHIRGIPKMLETPKGMSTDGRCWDVVNLEKLRSLRRR